MLWKNVYIQIVDRTCESDVAYESECHWWTHTHAQQVQPN